MVAIAAVPEVSWLPLVLTPGKLIPALPSKLTPPIFTAVASIVAEPASPVQVPELPLVLPVTLPVKLPAKALLVSNPELGL